MIEWIEVEPEDLTDPATGEKVTMRLLYAPEGGIEALREVPSAGESLTTFAHRYLGSAQSILKLCMANAAALIDHDWNLSRIRRLVIPR